MKSRHLLFMMMGIAAIAGSCSKNDKELPVPAGSTIQITVPDQVATANLKWVRINSQVQATNAQYLWTWGKDTLSTSQNLQYVFDTTGTFTLQFTVKTSIDFSTKNITVKVTDSSLNYANHVTKVFEYFPAPGQFINTMPEWNTGYSDQQMAAGALTAVSKEDMVSLGGFGGYIVMGFDHTIINKPGQYSFLVLGNAFPNSAEPGIIMVSSDVNGNGLPDDEWYEITGSEYNSAKTIKNYQITYYKPNEEKTQTQDPNDVFLNDNTYIRWEDNQGKSGYLSRNVFHSQPYYPQWKGESITFTGNQLSNDQIVNTSTDPDSPYWILPAFSWGYVDNKSNDDNDAKTKLDWAVDKNGKPVKLKGIDFIKVYSAIRAEAGWLGETSTEVAGVRDLRLK
ncbi:PKD domain-containing protein [Chitinophaga sp. 30R24]|uniref:PKD domain-containing protein n=1 Tax=Chitinophaga sp. 30R24 TaxID=3248838 RepID=UPI003B90F247